MSTRRYGLRDDQWDRIKDLLPERAGIEGCPAYNNCLFVEAVLYRYRAGFMTRSSGAARRLSSRAYVVYAMGRARGLAEGA